MSSLNPGLRSYIAFHDAFLDGSDTPRLPRPLLEVIETREDDVQAFVCADFDAARHAAEASTARWQSGSQISAIDGMPIGVKDIMETADLPTEQGSPLFKGWRGGRDCAAVAAPRGRRDHYRQNRDHRVRGVISWQDAQPLGPRPHAGRLEQGAHPLRRRGGVVACCPAAQRRK